MTTCKVDDKGVHPCHALDACLELGGVGTRYQGVKLQTLINMTTGKFARHLVTLKSGKHSKNGVVFNFCPFCGGTLLETKPDDEIVPGALADTRPDRKSGNV